MIKINFKTVLSFLIILITPLFFNPFIQDYFSTGKFYLLLFFALVLIFISTVNFLFSKKINPKLNFFESFLIFFNVSLLLSTIITSTNKIQSLLNPNFSFLMIFSLTLIYFLLSKSHLNIFLPLTLALSITSLIKILISLNIFKNPYLINPFGNEIDFLIFNIFILVYLFSQIFKKIKEKDLQQSLFFIFISLFNIPALVFSLIEIFNKNQVFYLSPFYLSWSAAIEILKNPMTAFFGVGIDNFSIIFNKVKDLAYNQSPLWQIYSFNLSRSTILHILTETGAIGLSSFLLSVIYLYKLAFSNKDIINKIFLVFITSALIFLPTSINLWFLFFLIASKINEKKDYDYFDLQEAKILHIGISIFLMIFLSLSSYIIGRVFLSEIYFKKSLDGFAKNNAKETYDNIKQAIILNPYFEKYRINFSQLNLLLANNFYQQIKDKKPEEVKEEDRQRIFQAIQIAISEAKAAVSLNYQKSQNWENLGNIYEKIIGAVNEADIWAISSYQRAVILDPQNPFYRFKLGQINYSINRYDDASRFFEQAISLKPDWPNAYYNLAWSYYQNKNYDKAMLTMNSLLSLIDKNKNKQDYEKVKKELDVFKNKLSEFEQESTKSGELNLPQKNQQPKLEPKLRVRP